MMKTVRLIQSKSLAEMRKSSPIKKKCEPISFEGFIMPDLQFGMKAFRKHLTEEKADKNLLKGLKNFNKF